MLVLFTDDYVEDIEQGLVLLGAIQSCLCCVEPFLGNSKILDKYYAHSVVISGIIDHLMHDDGSDLDANFALLLCLRSMRDMEICGCRVRPSVIDNTNYHINTLISIANPQTGSAFDQGVNQYNPPSTNF